MSRVEENQKLHLPNSFRDDIQVQIAQAKFLEDISRSLAVIADNVTEYIHSETEKPMYPEDFKRCITCRYLDEDEDNPDSVCNSCTNRSNWRSGFFRSDSHISYLKEESNGRGCSCSR